METTHQQLQQDARGLEGIPDASVHLVLTSPPYPMITMWDGLFTTLDPAAAVDPKNPWLGWEAQHRILDAVWAACARVLVTGGFLCVNIGDATRSFEGEFALYPNHARALAGALRCGLTPLPDILWRKPTNAPNKFMGSGMLPAGAYVTYEHEYVLILRKGGRRRFDTEQERANRARSAYFWEERNTWFSDLWADLPGARQGSGRGRERDRSGAFPLLLPYRLVQMYSVYGDTVLDPFAGTGTTLVAAALAGRNSLGVDRLAPKLDLSALPTLGFAAQRLAAHRAFVAGRLAAGRPLKHQNGPHGVPVVTRQEADLELLAPSSVGSGPILRVGYTPVRTGSEG